MNDVKNCKWNNRVAKKLADFVEFLSNVIQHIAAMWEHNK